MYILNSPTGLGAVDVMLASDALAAQDGEHLHSVRLGARTVHDTITVQGRTLEEMYSRRNRLCQLLSPQRGAGTLVYQNDHGEWKIEATPTVYGTSNARIIRNRCSASVSFLGADPMWRETVSYNTELQRASEPVPLPAALPVTLPNPYISEYISTASHAGAEVDFTIHGPAKNIRIVNYTTGEAAVIMVTLGENDSATLSKSRVTVSRNSGASTVEVIPEFGFSEISLAPGSNRIGISSEYVGYGYAVTAHWTRLFAGV